MFTWSLGWIDFFASQAVAAGQLDRPIGNHLVDVHVGRRAGTGLVDVDRELVVELARGHFAGSGQEGLDLPVIERILARAGQLAQVAVGHGGGPLDQGEGVDQFRGHGLAGNGEVLHRPLGLGPEIGLGRQADFTQSIVLDAEFGHFLKILCDSNRISQVRSIGK